VRLDTVNPAETSEGIRSVLDSQRKKWGAPLNNHLLYARCPEIFKGARAMWIALDRSGHIEPKLAVLVNRRVALLNGCEF
jgi:alkylhydroperoxidase family enzyme